MLLTMCSSKGAVVVDSRHAPHIHFGGSTCGDVLAVGPSSLVQCAAPSPVVPGIGLKSTVGNQPGRARYTPISDGRNPMGYAR